MTKASTKATSSMPQTFKVFIAGCRKECCINERTNRHPIAFTKKLSLRCKEGSIDLSEKDASSGRSADIRIAAPNTELVSRPPADLVATFHSYLSCWLILTSQRIPNANCFLSTSLLSAIRVRCTWRSIPIHLASQFKKST